MKCDFTKDEIALILEFSEWASRYLKEFNESIGRYANRELLDKFQQLINKVNKIRHSEEETV